MPQFELLQLIAVAIWAILDVSRFPYNPGRDRLSFMRASMRYFEIPQRVVCAIAGSVLAFQLFTPAPLAAQETAARAPPVSKGDFGGLVDIGGGRRIYLECRGTGSPTVVLEAGYRSSARVWSEDLRESGAPRTMVLAGVAAYTRVCAYDRPGTVAPLKDDARPSRSDPVPQPRTAPGVVADLHALLRAAGVPGPYVLAGHSLGGLFVRLYASTHPGEVVGLILVDPYSERLEALLTPERWAALVRLNVRFGTDTVKPIPGYGDFETLGYGKDNAVMRQAAASTPLGPMPLAVLAHGRPFNVTEEVEGFSSRALESVLRAANENMATLVPNARFFVAEQSGHDIHQDQPELVTEAIRQVVTGVRSPDTWYDLTSCCAK
jgi:pimeloyl-ACP methyl ester carboxylesterase